jgi:CheY-like chemotaxis protein
MYMSRKGSIIIVDDDGDDLDLIEKIVSQLNLDNPIIRFSKAEQLLNHLTRTKENPLVVLCDINMPLMNGLELKERLNAEPAFSSRCIPFVFLTTSANKAQVCQAHKLNAQGFVVKGTSFDQLKETLSVVIHYWQANAHPDDL